MYSDGNFSGRITFEKYFMDNVDFKDLVWSTWDIGVPNLIKVEAILL